MERTIDLSIDTEFKAIRLRNEFYKHKVSTILDLISPFPVFISYCSNFRSVPGTVPGQNCPAY